MSDRPPARALRTHGAAALALLAAFALSCLASPYPSPTLEQCALGVASLVAVGSAVVRVESHLSDRWWRVHGPAFTAAVQKSKADPAQERFTRSEPRGSAADITPRSGVRARREVRRAAP